jgi:hypothetical protein
MFVCPKHGDLSSTMVVISGHFLKIKEEEEEDTPMKRSYEKLPNPTFRSFAIYVCKAQDTVESSSNGKEDQIFKLHT